MRIDDIRIDLNGHELILRNATDDDAEMLLKYLKETAVETRFLVKEPEEIDMTTEEEKAFIKRQNESEGNIMLLGFLDGEFVGNCALNGMGLFRFRHRVTLGIALYQKFTGLGIGKVMMQTLIRLAKEMGYEQLELNKSSLGDDVKFLKENLMVWITSFEGEVLGITLPDKIEYVVTHSEPAVKGNTSSGAMKDATLENGLEIKVPLFINEGESVLVTTKDGKYSSRA